MRDRSSLKFKLLIEYVITFLSICCFQAKDRQKKKPTKAIRVDAEGDATLEDLTETVTQGTGNEPSEDTEKLKSNNKKVLWFLSIF